jgi:CheY-like chemotaxis protein
MNKTITVLVIDDSEICLDVARSTLQAEGWKVVTATSPLGVNRLVSTHDPDVLVVDVSMPALRGDKLVELVRRHQEHRLPILLYSTREPSELDELARSCGASGYVTKTADAAGLVEAVMRYIR